MKLFVGLGNPGADYARHRHNVGFMAVDAIAAAHGFAPWRAKFQGQIAEGRLGPEKVLLLKPGTYMNLSGDAVRAAMRLLQARARRRRRLPRRARPRARPGAGQDRRRHRRPQRPALARRPHRPRLHPRPHRHRPSRRQAAGLAPRARRLRQGRRRLARRPAARRRRRRARRSPPATPPASSNAVARRAAPPPEPAPRPGRRSPSRRRRPPPRTPAARCSGWSTASGDASATPSAPRPSICAGMGSPFTARLCRLLADRLAPGDPVADRVLGWPGDPSHRADALPLRLAGALHGLVLEGRDAGLAAVYPPHHAAADDDALWAAVAAAFAAHAPLRPRPPRRPAADQRDPAQRRARPGLPDRRGADRPAARHLRDRRQRRAEPDLGPLRLRLRRRRLGRPGLAGPHRPRLAGPAAAAARGDRRRARRLRPRPARPRPRGRPAAPPLLRLGRPDRAAGPHPAAIELARAAGVRVERADAADWLAARLADAAAGPGARRLPLDRLAVPRPAGAGRASAPASTPPGAGDARGAARLAAHGGRRRAGAAITLTLWPGRPALGGPTSTAPGCAGPADLARLPERPTGVGDARRAGSRLERASAEADGSRARRRLQCARLPRRRLSRLPRAGRRTRDWPWHSITVSMVRWVGGSVVPWS